MNRALGSGLAAFRNPGYPRYWGGPDCAGFAVQIQKVAAAWQVYDLTRDLFDLGLVGLSQFPPALPLVFVTGAVTDRVPRRRIMGVCLAAMAAVAGGLFRVAQAALPGVGAIFLRIAAFGTVRASCNPARQSMLPNLVPPADLANATTVSSATNQIAIVCGPVAGGLVYGGEPG